MKKADIKKLAIAVLVQNPEVAKAYATSDGQIFLTENAANLHKNTNAKGKELEVFEFDNPDAGNDTGSGDDNPVSEMNVKDAKEFIATLEVVEDLEAIAEVDERKGVKDAVAARIDELNNPED